MASPGDGSLSLSLLQPEELAPELLCSTLPSRPPALALTFCLMPLQRGTAPTQVSPLAQEKWAASTALKTVSPTTAAGGSPCVAPSGEHARKVALGVERSLLAKVTLNPCPQVRSCSLILKSPSQGTVFSPSSNPAPSTSKVPCRTSLLSPSHSGNPWSLWPLCP